MNGAKQIANDGRYAVQTQRIQGLVTTADGLPKALTADTSIYFQKLWIYPGRAFNSGQLTPNVGSCYVGDVGQQIASASATLQVKTNATEDQPTLITATVSSHGYATGDMVRISGASDGAYNGTFKVTVVDSNTFTYMLADPPATDAPTGTITAAGLQSVPVGNKCYPDQLLPTDLPLKYELPLGQKQQLASIVFAAGTGDGVYYRLWA